MKSFFKSFASRKEAVILTYHSIDSPTLPFKISHHVSEKLFEQHLRYLSEKCHCVSLHELLTEVKTYNNKLRTVAVTFDDGFANNYSTAFPLLKKYGIPATIFVTTSYIGTDILMWPETIALAIHLTKKKKININKQWYSLTSPKDKANTYRAFTIDFKRRDEDFISNQIDNILQQAGLTFSDLKETSYFNDFKILNWEQIKELLGSRLVTFGSHSINHKRLSHLCDGDATYEITESKKILENKLGPIDFFAYPYGGPDTDYNEQHKIMAKHAGYKAIATCIEGTVTDNTDIFQLPRISINSDCSVKRFAYLLNGGIAFKDGFSTRKLIHGFIAGRVS